MENSYNQLIAVAAALALCVPAVLFMYRDAVSRVTEALLDAVELTLARRASRRDARSGDEIHVTIFTHQ